MSETPPNPPENKPEPESAVGGAAPPDASPATPPDPAVMGDAADVEKNKVFALLAYLGILFLVPLLAAKDSKFAKFHANQGLLLFLAMIAIGVVLGMMEVVMMIIAHFVPFLAMLVSCFTCFLYPVLSLAWLALAIMGILNAINGKMARLPLFPKIDIIK